MKKFFCGFYGEPLKWLVSASSEQEAAKRMSEHIKQYKLASVSGTKEIVIFEAKEETK